MEVPGEPIFSPEDLHIMDGNPLASDEHAAHPAMTDGIKALGPQR